MVIVYGYHARFSLRLQVGSAKLFNHRRLLRRQVAEDMYLLIRRFADTDEHTGRNSYKAMERIFYEQYEVHEEKVCVKQKIGGNVMQNPSDPDATYDGHKGPGYQVQISETCHPENEAQLITCALPQTAVEPDTTATSEALDSLEESELLPREMFADTHYQLPGITFSPFACLNSRWAISLLRLQW